MKTRIFLLSIFIAISRLCMAANVVVQDDSTYVESSRTNATITFHRVILISNNKGKKAANWQYVLDKYSKLKNFSATIQQTDGKVIKKLKKSDLQITELSSGLGDDNSTYYLEYEPNSYPIKVSFDWTVENTNGVIAYPAFCPADNYDEEVTHASYTIRCTEGSCRYKALNCDSMLSHTKGIQESGNKFGTLSISQLADGCIKAVFNNLPALKLESYPQSLFKQMPMVLFAPNNFSYRGTQGKLDTWQYFGLWQYGLLKDRDQLSPEAKQKVHEMTDALKTKREKIARLYQYLYDTTRYVSIQLGIGGYQPATAEEVYTNGFGDCKGLSNYMVAMLREAGIQAIYTAISTQHADLLTDFPNLNQLDHVIVGVPMEKDTLWLECTNARFPLGYLHEDIAGHQALLITAQGGKIVRLPRYADTDNLQKSKVDIKVSNNGMADINIDMEKTNRQYENFLPLVSMSNADQQKNILSYLYLPAAQVKTLHIQEDKGHPIIHTTLDATCKYANTTGNRLFVPINPLKAGKGDIDNSGNRQSSFYLDFGYQDEEDITIYLPEGYKIESLPADKEIDTKFGALKFTITKEDNQVHATYKIIMHSGTFPAQDYQDFVKAKNTIAKACRQRVVIVKQ